MCDSDKKDKCAGVNGPIPCATCGNSSCSCNSTLTDHLKKCAGLGNLPPLFDKCEDIPGPGFRDRCPRSTCGGNDGGAGGGSGSGSGGSGSSCGSSCFACGQDKPPPPPPPAEEKVKCEDPPPVVETCDPSAGDDANGNGSGSGNGKKGKFKCPPMPVTDCTDCKPSWMTCPSVSEKSYPAPDGVEVLPISIGGRNGRKSGSCGKCGEKKSSMGKPKVSANCPMMRAKCPGVGDEVTGFFAKITSLFGFGKEKTPLETVCDKLKVEDEQIRHHRDVFNPELIVRKDGYMCPLVKKVECAGRNYCEPEPVAQNCGCVEEVIEQECVEEVMEQECVEEEELEIIEQECVEEVMEQECVEEEVIEQECVDEVIEQECVEEEVIQEDQCGCEEGVQEEYDQSQEKMQEEEGCKETIQKEETNCEKVVEIQEEVVEEVCSCSCTKGLEPIMQEEDKEGVPANIPSSSVDDDDDEDDECIEDAEGECVRQEDDEESEPEDPNDGIPDFKGNGQCTFSLDEVPACCEKCQQKGETCCTPMNNFVIRVQAPFSDGSYQSCESVLESLCKSRAPMYPDPRELTKDSCGIKVLEISLEPPTCVETPLSNCPCKPEDPEPPKSDCSCNVEPPKPECLPKVEAPKPEECQKIEAPKPECPKIETPKPECPPKVEAPKPESAPIVKPSSPCENPKPNSEKPSPPCPPVQMANSCPAKVPAPTPTCKMPPPPENTGTDECYTCGKINCSCNNDLKQHIAQLVGREDSSPVCPSPEEPKPEPKPCPPPPSPEVKPCPPRKKVCPPPPKIEAPKPPAAEWNYEAIPLSWDPSPPQQQCPTPEPVCLEEEVLQEPEPEPVVEACVEEDSIPDTTESITEDLPATATDFIPLPTEQVQAEDCTTSEAVSSPPPEPQNDCTTLTPEELLKKRLKDISCGCPNCSGDGSGTGTSVWSPPAPPSCAICGAKVRGDNENCVMCNYTRKARDPYRYDVICPTSILFNDDDCASCSEESTDKCESDVFDMTSEGKPVYEGGMCISRVNYFLWKTNPYENSLKRMAYPDECFDGFRPARDESNDDDGPKEQEKYKGGMSCDECRDFIWKATSKK